MLIVIHQEKKTLYFSHRFLKCLGCAVHLAVGNPMICINTDCIRYKDFKLDVNKRHACASAETHNVIRTFISNYHIYLRIKDLEKSESMSFFSFGTPSSVFHADILETQVLSSRNIHLCMTEKVRKTERMRKKYTDLSWSCPLHLFLSSAHERCSAQVLLDLDEFGSAARALLLTFLLLLQLGNMYRYILRKWCS